MRESPSSSEPLVQSLRDGGGIGQAHRGGPSDLESTRVGSRRSSPFGADNVEALKAALPASSLALAIVCAVESSPSIEDAKKQLSILIERRLVGAREELDAETPVA